MLAVGRSCGSQKPLGHHRLSTSHPTGLDVVVLGYFRLFARCFRFRSPFGSPLSLSLFLFRSPLGEQLIRPLTLPLGSTAERHLFTCRRRHRPHSTHIHNHIQSVSFADTTLTLLSDAFGPTRGCCCTAATEGDDQLTHRVPIGTAAKVDSKQTPTPTPPPVVGAHLEPAITPLSHPAPDTGLETRLGRHSQVANPAALHPYQSGKDVVRLGRLFRQHGGPRAQPAWPG